MEERNMKISLDNENGRVAVPIALWFLGVPGFLVIILWFFFFRGN
jgi:hypothetical protein